MTVILVIGVVWLVVLVFTLALLRMAALSDRDAEAPQIRAAHTPQQQPALVRDRRSGIPDRRAAAR